MFQAYSPVGAIAVGAGLSLGGNANPTGSVIISGTIAVGETLTASNDIADADGLGPITYQWLRNDTEISGENGTTYVILQTDVGSVIKVRATYTDGGSTVENVVSAGTAPVPNTLPTGLPVITGTKRNGATLTCDVSGIADSDGLGSFNYQWLRDDADIAGATNSSYLLTAFDVNTSIKCRVSFTDGGGTLETLITSAYGVILGASVNSYQECYFPVVINPAHIVNTISGDSAHNNFVLKITLDDIPPEFMDGGIQSAENGGGNIRVHTSSDLSGASRLALKVDDFDINAGTATLKTLMPILPVGAGDTLYIAKGNPADLQPAPNAAYGADEVSLYDPDLVPPADPSDLKSTYDNMNAVADFLVAGSMVCSLVNLTPPPANDDDGLYIMNVMSGVVFNVLEDA